MTPPRARVAWSIDGRTGHGEWENPIDVQAWVDWGNATFGPGTHWIEWEGDAA